MFSRHADRNRALPRRTEKGAALFVVVMVITLLTAVGLFAARTTSLVDAATGYARQQAQSAALAGYGAQIIASELGEGRAQLVFQLMNQPNQYCLTYGDQSTSPQRQPCYAYDYNQLEARVKQNTGTYNVIEYPDDTGHDGSLGPALTPSVPVFGLGGVLVVEIFDPFDIANIQGESASKPSGRQVTVNSIAQIRPFSSKTERDQEQSNTTWCSTNTAAAAAASLLSVRSQVIVPTL
jgi:hypothetical protein